MVRGPDYRALPPFRALPSKPIAPAEAEKLLTTYLDASEAHPHLHPDAVLNPAGVQFSIQGGTQGGITLHNLRRVQAGLRGENLAPEPYKPADAAEDEDPIPQEGDAAPKNTEDMADELENQEQATSEAIGQDPLQNQHQPSSPPAMDAEPASESDSDEEDDPSRYITPQKNNKGMFSKKKKKANVQSDDSRLDAKIREAALKAKRKRRGSEVTPDAQEQGKEGRKEKKAKIAAQAESKDEVLNDEQRKAKQAQKKADQKAEKAKLKAESKAKKAARNASREKKPVEDNSKTGAKTKDIDADSKSNASSALLTSEGSVDASSKVVAATPVLPSSVIKTELEENKEQRVKPTKAEKRERKDKKKKAKEEKKGKEVKATA